jgi:hypothetical protein
MNFLPIATRELQVTSRRKATYYWRSFAGLNAACLTLAFVFTGFNGALSTASAGETAFEILACAGYAFAAYAGSLLTADCISEERRDGTLGLLLLTDLTGFDIVFGKLSRLANPVFCLVAAFPTLGFALILGGVSVGNFLGVGFALLNALFFFASMGLLISALACNGPQAVGVASFAALLFSSPGFLALSGIHPSLATLVLSPAGMFLSAMGTTFSAVPASIYWWSFLATHLMGWTFLAAASFLVTRISLEQGKVRTWRRRPRNRVSAAEWGSDPVLSLVARSMKGPTTPWWFGLGLAAFVVLTFVTAMVVSPSGWFDLPTFGIIAIGCHLALKFAAANDACRCLTGRRQSGELELLLTTPLDQDALVQGSAIALKRQLLWPVLLVLALDLALLVAGWCKVGLWNGFGWGALLLVEVVWFLGNLYSLTWLGMVLGLKSASHSKAMGRTLFYILLMPWSGLIVAVVCFGIATLGNSMTPGMVAAMVAEFVVLIVVCNCGFAGWAVSELKDRFRILAAQQQLADAPRGSSPFALFLGGAREKIVNCLRR